MEHLAESSILKEIKQCVALWPGFHQHLPKTESATSMDAATDQEFYPRPPDVTEVQEKAIHRKACELVAAAVLEQESPQDSTLEDAASQKLMGCFLTLKRQGQLRGCCGVTGKPLTLLQSLEAVSVATASRDARFPPGISLSGGTSADVSGDTTRVVGYAGVAFSQGARIASRHAVRSLPGPRSSRAEIPATMNR